MTAVAFAADLTRAGTGRPFEAFGLCFDHVPSPVVDAYAAARLAREDPLRAVVAASVGEAGLREALDAPGAVIWDMGRGWVRRLGELERIVRGLPPAGVNREVEVRHG